MTISDASYSNEKVTYWTNKITEQSLVSLTKLQKTLKFIGEKQVLKM
jgi:hypothetical protein